jgi:hypothetical protein
VKLGASALAPAGAKTPDSRQTRQARKTDRDFIDFMDILTWAACVEGCV